jgi:hypothetical protein
MIQLNMNAPESGRLQLNVIDASGKEIISSRNMDIIGGEQIIDLALGNLAAGLYFLQASWNNQPAGVHRFLIAK